MTSNTEADYDRISDEIVELLRERPMDETEIAAELGKRGVSFGGEAADEDAADQVSYLLDESYGGKFLMTGEGKWFGSQAALARSWFTHRVTEDELACDVLSAGIDLLTVSLLLPDQSERPIHGGGSIQFVLSSGDAPIRNRDVPEDLVPISGALVLDPGALVNLGAGEGSLIGLCLRGEDWQLSLLDSDQLADPEPVIAAVKSMFADEEVMPPVGVDQVIGSICAGNPDLLEAPIAPLSEALSSGDLVLFGDAVGPPDFDVEEWQRERLVKRLRGSYELDFEQGEATADLISYVQMFGGIPAALRAAELQDEGDQDVDDLELADEDWVASGLATSDQELRQASVLAAAPGALAAAEESATHGSTNPIDELAPWLSSARVAKAVWAEAVALEDDGATGLAMFVESAMKRAPGPARPGLWWLQGRLWEQRGEPLKAKICFEAALDADRSWKPALIWLAKIESDRGQAQAALRLLDQAGEEADESMVTFLQGQIPKVRKDVPRNAKCPCGSGRKFKQCHMRQNMLPLDERAQWLYNKALVFFEDNYGELIVPLARIRAAHDASPEAMIRALQDGLVVDVALCEGEIFEAFLENRGELLPQDERSMAEQWLLQERSVFDVQSVRSGRSLTLRDVRTGDVIEVSERSASRQLTKGDLICTRVLPVDDSWQVFGGIEPIRLHERKQILDLLDSDASPVDLIERLSARFAPPTMQTMEGESVVFCNATITVEDPGTLAGSFDAKYLREDESDSESRWLELIEVHGADRVRATFTLTGDSLHVFCNSAERFDRVLAYVGEVDPGRQMVSETREPLDIGKVGADEAAPQRRQELRDFQEEALADPDITAALAEMIRNHEKAWLDEAIPALDGFTPREAAVDPTRRGDLIRLLDSYPSAEGNPGVMDPDRLRAALSL